MCLVFRHKMILQYYLNYYYPNFSHICNLFIIASYYLMKITSFLKIYRYHEILLISLSIKSSKIKIIYPIYFIILFNILYIIIIIILFLVYSHFQLLSLKSYAFPLQILSLLFVIKKQYNYNQILPHLFLISQI